MKNLSIAFTIGIVLLAQKPAFADDVPKLDVNTSCKAATQAYSASSVAQCLTQEENARQLLATQWNGFPVGSRAQCVRMMNSIAATQSYVELLTCLQIARDASKVKD